MLNNDSKLTGRLVGKNRQGNRPFLLLIGAFLSFVCIDTVYAADPLQGGKSYQSHCINCHGANGAGEIPNAPDFARGERLLQPDNTLLETIKSGKGMMPAYRGVLTDEEIRDVIAYVRTLRR